MDSEGLMGAIAIGKLIDSEVLNRLNFDRSDILLMVFDEAGNVVTPSSSSSAEGGPIPITPDAKMVAIT